MAAVSLSPPLNTAPKSTPHQSQQLTSLLCLCKNLREAQQIHAGMIKSSQISDRHSAARMTEFYAISDNGNHLHHATKIFQTYEDEPPSTFMCNSLMRGNLLNQNPHGCLQLFLQLLIHSSIHPDHFTFTFAIKAASKALDLPVGKQIHGQVLKRGLQQFNLHIENKLIHFYAIFQEMVSARKVFDGIIVRDIVSWNSMLEGYAIGRDNEALHALFDEMPVKDIISWNTVIGFYIDTGRFEEAIITFRSMQTMEEVLNRVTLISVISAIAQIGALGQGKWIHAYMKRKKINLVSDEHLTSALINMYSKCGCIEAAMMAFEESDHRAIDNWNAIIGGLTANGQSRRALNQFSKLEEEKVKPNAITYACILNACSHGGYIDEASTHFNNMKEIHNIIPDITHYGCMVDLYSRAGIFQKATEIIDGMPMSPDAVMWKAIMGGCRLHQNMEIGEKAGLKLIETAPQDHAGYVLLSNLYAMRNDWIAVQKIRTMMKQRGVRKPPGCSSIESQGVVHEFVVGDTLQNHPAKKKIYSMVEEMGERARHAGYIPDTESVLLDIEDEDVKEKSLDHHSEKLAIAFGFISSVPGSVVRVVKNLRVCRDCHRYIAFLSKVYGRDIIVRDANRFHHFSGGVCSCLDYW
ncbi:Pentatricopeptide repeat-containing protein [Zostera marina]|uniref:Pentatricopeptide repeat-containing protein n=1 Tax=Zostera marina TaxID=29655 RepID=A0A0K9NNT7_ZOSMR|nr:Pentatricopeptide repeat-containing protein [Zostera marina]